MGNSPGRVSICFFQLLWDVVLEDVMNFFDEVYSIGSLSKDKCATFIALMPDKRKVR